MAFGHRVGQVGDHVGAEAIECFAEDRGPGDAVDVEVAEDSDGFPGANGGCQSRQGGINSGKRIGRVWQIGRVEEPGQRRIVADAPGQEQLNGGGGQAGPEAVAVGPGREQPAPGRGSMLRGSHSPDRVKTITELWPPNPKELLSATLMSPGRAALGT